MRSTVWSVALREMRVMLRRPSWYITTFVMPLLTLGFFLAMSVGFSFMARRLDRDAPMSAAQPAGYVDQAGILRALPPDVEGQLIAFEDEAGAAAALRSGAIGSFFVIPPDYLSSGTVVRVARQTGFTDIGESDVRALRLALRFNLVGDAQVAERLERPLEVAFERVGERVPAGDGNPFRGPAIALALLLGFAIINSSGWLTQAIAEEKENRTIEVLLTSVSPMQLMQGKLLGLGLMSLLQLSVWALLGGGLVGLSASALGDLALGTLSAVVWLWCALAFVLGFLCFGALLMGLGAVGGSLREAAQVSGFLTLPLFIPFWFAAAFSQQPDGWLPLALSFFPLTAPVAMVLRLVNGVVPLWQLVLSAALLVLATAVALWITARLFRSTILLSGTRPTPQVVWRLLRTG
ncbi:ABC transporter permease [Kallotenue papyrolyticum]|uniref:ABC transporter permease n=1 Tax=Kallotenue papyrolyticum TaxID=1325125 RepID=UPI0004922714|nr:ABC transporter permease [Kallotenue papyrolyticum]